MTNTQQPELDQVSSVERPQEEVQLTELLPVERIWLKDYEDDENSSVADAFKALRGGPGVFSRFKHVFEAENVAFDTEVDVSSKGNSLSDEGFKNTREDTNCSKRGPEENPRKIRERRTETRTAKDTRKRNDRAQGNGNRNKARKINGPKGVPNVEENEATNGETPSKITDQKDNSPSKNASRSKKQEVSHVAEKKKEFSEKDAILRDEHYVFRQEKNVDVPEAELEIPGNGFSNANNVLFGANYVVTENLNNTENGNASYNTFPTGITTLQPQTVLIYFQNNLIDSNTQLAHGFFPNNNVHHANKTQADSNASFYSTKDASHQVSQKDITEENLRHKIDAIIQANYFLEQENNNVVQQNNNQPEQTPLDPTPLKEPSATTGLNQEFLQKKYHCAICSARFKGSGGLRTHYKVVHGAGPVFACNDCGKEFPLKERLKLHVRTHTGYKPYKCPDCSKSFARGGQLVQHRRTHSQVKPYQCALCSGSFSCAANLALHLKRHSGQKDHKCEICGRAFVRRDALKKHLDCLHKDVKSFLCHICNKTLKGHLPQHMRTHAQDRPHGCATCGQRFAQKSQLTVHQRTHSGQRPFRCLVCWQAFAHSTALKLHTRRHTGERPFKCAECSAGFTQLPHWKKHMKCVHGRNEPYCCRKCNSFFRIKNDLESHEKSCLAEVEGVVEGTSTMQRYRVMTVERMRLLLAVLLKRISKPERLNELGFGKRLIDEVLKDSLVSAGKVLVQVDGLGELEALRRNLAVFLEWTVPEEHWKAFQKTSKTPEEILETLTST